MISTLSTPSENKRVEVTNAAPPVYFVPYSTLKGTGAYKEGPDARLVVALDHNLSTENPARLHPAKQHPAP
jgi:hypothetical protein